jgi:phosphoribosyl-ATP pyrophosphohydrolase/phosphoribosyl-AMP cyclohydrolase
MALQNLKFDERGLIPTIVQDRLQGHIVMFSYMNPEALALTLQTGIAHFWHPTTRRVLQQADVAGRAQRVVDMMADSEGDALIIQVESAIPSSPTGEATSHRANLIEPQPKSNEVSIVNLRSMEIGLMLSELFQLIGQLERERPENSYTTRLFEGGLDFILKRLNEQVTESIIAAKNKAQQKLSNHLADLLYHLLVLMVERELDLRDILSGLRQRAGLSHQPLPQEPRRA